MKVSKTLNPDRRDEDLKREVAKRKKEDENKHSLKEFELERILGQGTFGMVYLAKQIETGKYCALKQIDKTVTKKMGKSEHAKTEKNILVRSKSPFLLKAILTFQGPHLAWLALEYCPGGDLHEFLKVYQRFEEPETLLYFAEMIMGVHDLHKMGYLHRDLKPANFLIDKTGHIKLADFGLAKHIHAVGKSRTSGESDDSADGEKDKATGITDAEIERRKKEIWKMKTKEDRVTVYDLSNLHDYFKINKQQLSKRPLTRQIRPIRQIPVSIPDKKELRKALGNSIVGSPEYMSPEVTSGRHLGGSYYGEEIDWWSLGCVFFEMIFGAPPFSGDSPEELFLEIDLWSQKLPKIFEENRQYLSDDCYSLLTGFLCDQQNRLGRNLEKIKCHPFFNGVKWNDLLSMTPPVVPKYPPEMNFLTK